MIHIAQPHSMNAAKATPIPIRITLPILIEFDYGIHADNRTGMDEWLTSVLADENLEVSEPFLDFPVHQEAELPLSEVAKRPNNTEYNHHRDYEGDKTYIFNSVSFVSTHYFLCLD